MPDRKKKSMLSKSIIDTQKDRQEMLKNAHQARRRKRRVEKIYQKDILKWCTGCVERVGKIFSAARKAVIKAMRD